MKWRYPPIGHQDRNHKPLSVRIEIALLLSVATLRPLGSGRCKAEIAVKLDPFLIRALLYNAKPTDILFGDSNLIFCKRTLPCEIRFGTFLAGLFSEFGCLCLASISPR